VDSAAAAGSAVRRVRLNVFNTDNFQAYKGSLESSTFGQPARALPKRRQQFGFRIDF